MATRLQVTCIVRDTGADPDRRIDSIGGAGWKKLTGQAIHDIEAGTHSFFTRVAGKDAEVLVASYKGRKYLKTAADGEQPNNLLSLPECL